MTESDRSDRPVLLACSHGTRSVAGQGAVSALVRAVAADAPDLEVRQAFVDVEQPSVPDAVAELAGRDVRVVPLLLSAGYHVHVDLAAAVAAAPPGVRLMPTLGPDPALVALLAERAARVGLRAEDTVLLAAAGSSDERAVADCRATAEAMAGRLGRPVTATFLSAARPAVADAVAEVRRGSIGSPGRVVVVCYLLAPGFFADRLADCGADVVTPPLLVPDAAPDPRLVELVLRRGRAG